MCSAVCSRWLSSRPVFSTGCTYIKNVNHPPKKLLLICIVACGTVPLATASPYDRINVTDYGAVPNDGGDDTAAINNAINAAYYSDSSIYFPAGTYNFTGSMWLPDGHSHRVYGDGPGVSVLIFNGNPYAGIAQGKAGGQSVTSRRTDAASKHGECRDGHLRKLQPNNEQIPHAYDSRCRNRREQSRRRWQRLVGQRVYAYRAQNAVIDKLEIDGRTSYWGGGGTSVGIEWNSDPSTATTGMQITNAQIKYCDSAVYTHNHVEGLYMSGFEIVLCGTNSRPALDISSTQYGAPAFNILNGHVEMIADGLRMTNLSAVKVSHVDFEHVSDAAQDGTHAFFDGCIAVSVSDCTFTGRSGKYANENGVYLNNVQLARVTGNMFRGLQPTSNGSCIVMVGGWTPILVTENLFSDIRSAYYDLIGARYNDNGI